MVPLSMAEVIDRDNSLEYISEAKAIDHDDLPEYMNGALTEADTMNHDNSPMRICALMVPCSRRKRWIMTHLNT